MFGLEDGLFFSDGDLGLGTRRENMVAGFFGSKGVYSFEIWVGSGWKAEFLWTLWT